MCTMRYVMILLALMAGSMSVSAQTISYQRNAKYGQEPSDTDLLNAKTSGQLTHLVFAMGRKRIFVYNGNRQIGSISFSILKKHYK